MTTLRRPVTLALALFLSWIAAAAQAGPPLRLTPHDSRVLPPATVLGFDPTERPARHDDVVRYFEALAAASPRARLERYGQTHEGKDLLLLIISSEANLKRLDEVRAHLAAIALEQPAPSGQSLDQLVEKTPAVAFLAYSIHGDEFSGTDAALLVAHELAASEAPARAALRDELVILIDPLSNPDGRDRILAMNAAFAGSVGNPDPSALSHAGVWPWGRGNHYFFDLNRDGFAQVHPESAARAAVHREWRPQLVMDAHEMGSASTFLASPPRDPFNPNLPSATRQWWDVFFADEARTFDRHGWSYYHGEWFEEFYPGRGRAIAPYVGAVDVLHEQASTDAQSIRKPSGEEFSYAAAVHRQYVSSFANLETTAANRRELLRSYRATREEAIERGRRGNVRAFYFSESGHPGRARRLVERLGTLGIQVERLATAGRIRARHVVSGEQEQVDLPAGAFRIRLDQPHGLLARVILEPHVQADDAFLASERLRLERGQRSRIYDVTAWSFLIASGLEGWWAERLDRLDWTAATQSARPATSVGEAGYGWLFDGRPDAAATLAAELTANGVVVRCGDRPFTLGGRQLARGSFLVRREENLRDVRTILARLASERGIDVIAANTAQPEVGPSLGGGHWHLLAEPRIGIVAGGPTDFYSVGSAWHLLDSEHGVRVSLLDVSRLGRLSLDRYNVIVFPNARGGAAAYRRALGKGGLAAVKRWVEAGGTYVGIMAGAELASSEGLALSEVRPRREVVSDFPAPRLGLSPEAIASLRRLRGSGLPADRAATPERADRERSDRRRSNRDEDSWPAALDLPGTGSPVLGTGATALLGRREATPTEIAHHVAPEDERTEDVADAHARLRRFLPSGATLLVELDPDSWLSHGVGDRVVALVRRGDALIAPPSTAVAGRYAAPEELHVGGILWPEAAGYLGRTAWLTRERQGRGQAILFADDPNFRGYYWGTSRPFLNAVLLGPGLGADRGIAW